MTWETDAAHDCPEGMALFLDFLNSATDPIEIRVDGHDSDMEPLFSFVERDLFTAADLLAVAHALALWLRPDASAREFAEASRRVQICLTHPYSSSNDEE